MDDLIIMFMEFIVVAAFLVAPIYVAKQLVPGSYRFMKRLMLTLGKPLARLLLLNQIKRRGLAYAFFVHVLGLLALITIVTGIITGTCVSIVSGLLLIAFTMAAKRFLDNLRRLRSRRRAMPGWRRP